MRKILIVDDEPALRFLITSALEDEGFELVEAVDGEEAMTKVTDERPDLIILDVMMPGLSGYEVCERLKADSNTKHIPIIMLTAKGQQVDQEKAKKSGADYFLTKPFSPLKLLDLVESIVAKG